MPSGLKGYNIRLDGVLLNPTVVPDANPFSVLGLDPAVDYSDRITMTAVDNAGNETPVPVSLAALSLAAVTQVPNPDDELPLEERQFVDGIINSGLTSRCPGALVGIYTEHGTYLQAYGTDKKKTLTLDDKMCYGSVTKIYTATLILMRIRDGLLSFDDVLEDFVPGVANGDHITIRQLLNMTSGIKDYSQQDAAVQQSYFLSPTVPIDPMPHILSYAPLSEPGGTMGSYSNSNYFLLGKILEVIDAAHGTGRNMRTILLEDCVQEMDLTATEWPTGVNMTAPFSRGYCLNFALAQIQSILGPFAFLAALLGYPTGADVEFTAVDRTISNTAGALDGTIEDFMNAGRSFSTGALLGPEMKKLRDQSVDVTYAEYTAVNPYDGPGWMGFGLGVISWGEEWLGWQGNNAGYLSNLWWNTRTGTVIAILFNYVQAPGIQSFYQIAQYLHPESLNKNYPRFATLEGIPSAEAFGSVRLLPAGTIGMDGIPSSEAPGSQTVVPPAAVIEYDSFFYNVSSYTPTLTINLPIAAGEKTIVVALAAGAGTAGVKCDGATMTLIDTVDNLSFWKIALAPTNTAHTAVIVATGKASGGWSGVAWSHSGVNNVALAAKQSGGTSFGPVSVNAGAGEKLLQAWAVFNASASGANVTATAGGTVRLGGVSDANRTGIAASEAVDTTTFTASYTPAYISGIDAMAVKLT